MLFLSDSDGGIIYNLKTFKIFKKIDIKNINKVIIGDIFNKKCLIVLYNFKSIIQINDFYKNEIIYKIRIYNIDSYYEINCMLLLNYKIYIIYSDEYNVADIGVINLITDEQKFDSPMYNNKYYKSSTHLIQPYKLQKIKLKNFGECVLALPKWETEPHESIALYYFKENINNYTKEEIKKKEEKILNSFQSYKNKEKEVFYNNFYINNLEKQFKKKGFKSDEELLNRIKQLENNSKIINNIIELHDIKILIYKRHKEEFKNKEKIIQEIFKTIENYKHEFSLLEKELKNRIRFKIHNENENENSYKAKYDVEFPDIF